MSVLPQSPPLSNLQLELLKIYSKGISEEDAFAIAEVPFMWNPRWTFAHEVAHLFEARHNRTNNVGGSGGGDEGNCQHGPRK